MTALDSRALTYVDCFGLKFPKPGRYRYAISTAAGAGLADQAAFGINVRAADGKPAGRQHDVRISLVGRELLADPTDLEIDAGDLVLWNTVDSRIPGLAIFGEGAGTRFDSRQLVDQALYSHAFGLPGRYEWRDAFEGKVGGVIEVRSLDATDRKGTDQWIRDLAKGTLVTVKGQDVSPERVEILTGQTVFWAIEDTRGISITEAELLADAGAKASSRTSSA